MVETRVPLVICPGDHNAAYLAVKREKLGHLIDDESKNKGGRVILIYCDTSTEFIDIRSIKEQLDYWSKDNFLELSKEPNPRLSALLEKPSLIWNVNIEDNKLGNIEQHSLLLSKILVKISKLNNVRKVGIVISNSNGQLMHPSVDIIIKQDSINNIANSSSIINEIWKTSEGQNIISWC